MRVFLRQEIKERDVEIKGFKEGDRIRVLVGGWAHGKTAKVTALAPDAPKCIGTYIRSEDPNAPMMTTWFQPHEIVKITE
jgi:hypothetical protein